MLKKLEDLFDNLTSLKAEDMIGKEEMLFSSYAAWFSEATMIVVTLLSSILSVGLFVYGWLTNVSGIWASLLYGFAIICFFSGFLFSAGLLMNHYSKRYFLTNHRVIVRTGLFSKKLVYVQFEKIQNVRISKSIGERMVDIGDIYIDTSGGDQTEVVILDIPDPEKMQRMILQGMESEKIGV
ncbi:MAG: PH domain-containing protein [Candidatus Altiarchaeia archaeon]